MHGTSRMSRAVRVGSAALAALAAAALALGAGTGPALAQDPAPRLAVSGTVIALPDESGVLTGSGAPARAAAHHHGLFLATDAGPILPLDARTLDAASGGRAAPGTRLSGAVELPGAVALAVEKAGSSLGERRTLALVASTAKAGDLALPVAEATVPRRLAASGPSPQHTSDLVFVSRGLDQPAGTEPGTDDMRALVQRASDYWVGQLNGRLTGISTDAARTQQTVVLPGTDVCDPEAMWNQAAALFGKTPDDYNAPGTTRHLIVLVSDASDQCGVGLGTVGPKFAGGLVWVNLFEEPLEQATHTLAHELGHNLDLAHANARSCEGSAVDATYEWVWVNDSNGQPAWHVSQVALPCKDLEYGDLWSAMGIGVWGLGDVPALISVNQLDYLGATPSGSLAGVPVTGVTSRTFTLNALGLGTGLRGLKVRPIGGDPFYVEYRTSTGQDAGFPRPLNLTDYPFTADTGVKVIKTMPLLDGWGAESAVLTRQAPPAGSGRYAETLSAGQSIHPLGNATVTVLSATGQQARVRVDFVLKRFTSTPRPRIVGTLKAGKRLTVRAGSWRPSGAKLSYRWKRNGTAIGGATKSSYTLKKADRKKRITVTVTASRYGYLTVSKTSKRTGRIR